MCGLNGPEEGGTNKIPAGCMFIFAWSWLVGWLHQVKVCKHHGVEH